MGDIKKDVITEHEEKLDKMKDRALSFPGMWVARFVIMVSLLAVVFFGGIAVLTPYYNKGLDGKQDLAVLKAYPMAKVLESDDFEDVDTDRWVFSLEDYGQVFYDSNDVFVPGNTFWIEVDRNMIQDMYDREVEIVLSDTWHAKCSIFGTVRARCHVFFEGLNNIIRS